MSRGNLRAGAGLVVMACAACSFQQPPQATVVVNADRQPTSHAVLVLPTACVTAADDSLCLPKTYYDPDRLPRSLEPTFGGYIDPALRLKLELAGFTLAEAAAMRVETADRVDIDDASRVEDTPTVADLGIEDVRTVAVSLALTSLLVPTLTIHRITLAQVRAELVVALLDVQTMSPRWTVTCSEILFTPDESSNRIANCAANGVLAALAPENLIGKAL